MAAALPTNRPALLRDRHGWPVGEISWHNVTIAPEGRALNISGWLYGDTEQKAFSVTIPVAPGLRLVMDPPGPYEHRGAYRPGAFPKETP